MGPSKPSLLESRPFGIPGLFSEIRLDMRSFWMYYLWTDCSPGAGRCATRRENHGRLARGSGRYAQERRRMHVHDQVLDDYLRGSLPESEASEIRSHVADCPACGAKLDETKAFIEQFPESGRRQSAEPERRQNQRIPVNGFAVIKLIHPSVSESLPARILNVSKDGLKVEVSQLLEAGMTVQIVLERSIAIAEVRYCIRAGEAYHVGVSIQDVFTKSGTRR